MLPIFRYSFQIKSVRAIKVMHPSEYGAGTSRHNIYTCVRLSGKAEQVLMRRIRKNTSKR